MKNKSIKMLMLAGICIAGIFPASALAGVSPDINGFPFAFPSIAIVSCNTYLSGGIISPPIYYNLPEPMLIYPNTCYVYDPETGDVEETILADETISLVYSRSPYYYRVYHAVPSFGFYIGSAGFSMSWGTYRSYNPWYWGWRPPPGRHGGHRPPPHRGREPWGPPPRPGFERRPSGYDPYRRSHVKQPTRHLLPGNVREIPQERNRNSVNPRIENNSSPNRRQNTQGNRRTSPQNARELQTPRSDRNTRIAPQTESRQIQVMPNTRQNIVPDTNTPVTVQRRTVPGINREKSSMNSNRNESRQIQVMPNTRRNIVPDTKTPTIIPRQTVPGNNRENSTNNRSESHQTRGQAVQQRNGAFDIYSNSNRTVSDTRQSIPNNVRENSAPQIERKSVSPSRGSNRGTRSSREFGGGGRGGGRGR